MQTKRIATAADCTDRRKQCTWPPRALREPQEVQRRIPLRWRQPSGWNSALTRLG